MKADLIDRSNYFRGMLVLIGRDRIIHSRERELVLQFGKALDFDMRFCEATITDLLENKYINEEPILFDAREMAECFLRDGFRLSLADMEIHSQEIAWLKTVALANNLPDDWIKNEYQKLKDTRPEELIFENFDIHQYL